MWRRGGVLAVAGNYALLPPFVPFEELVPSPINALPLGSPTPAAIVPTPHHHHALPPAATPPADIAAAKELSLKPGLAANLMCTPVLPSCGCGLVPGLLGCVPGHNMFQCPCRDVTFGFLTTGKCVALKKCLAVSTVGGILDPNKLLLDLGIQLLSGLIGRVSLGGAGSGSSGSDWTTIGGGTGGCTQYFQTSNIADLSNPCAQYVAPYVSPVSDSINPPQNTSTWTAQINPNAGADTASLATNSPTPTQRQVIFQPTSIGGIGAPSGLRGDIVASSQDATIIAGSRDGQANVEVSGFYGSQTFGSQSSEGLVSQWCRARPWASNFLSKIVAPTFFDGICKARGYQVGEPPPLPAPPAQTALPAARPATTSVVTHVATSAPTVKSRVDIWAVPPSVPLGARTSIFWSTQGVVSCTQTSSDGHFNERSLAGGAATVPITEAISFYITCMVSDGTTISSSAVVNLKI